MSQGPHISPFERELGLVGGKCSCDQVAMHSLKKTRDDAAVVSTLEFSTQLRLQMQATQSFARALAYDNHAFMQMK
jgi:hypothetical protein